MSDLSAVARLFLIAGVCAVLLSLTHWLTAPRIADNLSQKNRSELLLLLGNQHNISAAELPDTAAGGDCWYLPVPGLSLHRIQASGYGGPLTLLATLMHGSVDNLRVTLHQETPGITDFLSRPDTGWLASLRGRDDRELSAVDSVSGATITSRAILAVLVERTAGSAVSSETPGEFRCRP